MENENIKHKDFVPIKVLVVYSVLFFAAWFAYEFALLPLIEGIGNSTVESLLEDGVIKNLIWTVPAIFMVSKYRSEMSVNLRELFKFDKSQLKYLWIFAAFAGYIILSKVIHGGKLAVNDSFGWDKVIVCLFVGVTEETVFRGWLLNATVDKNKKAALIINALMFLAIHFPRWLYEGIFITNFVSLGFICIIVLSFVFSEMFIRTKSLVLPITLHMFWDLLMFML
ncbi:MAG: CPBP family intramembrane metalloprotease [Lachnospiraceae bacterium]|nr:CPBP family intramembrane metalloprotease [Lachnospiraceae bacterium]